MAKKEEFSMRNTEMNREFSAINPASTVLCSNNAVMQKIRDVMLSQKKLIVGMNVGYARNQLPLSFVKGVYTDKSLSNEICDYEYHRLKARGVVLPNEVMRTHKTVLTTLYLLEHGAVYVATENGGKLRGMNRVTRSTLYIPPADVKSSVKKEQLFKTVESYIHENEQEQIMHRGIKAYSIEKNSNGKMYKKKITVNPCKSVICPHFVLEWYVKNLIIALRKNELLINYTDNSGSSVYTASLEDWFIKRYFSVGYDEMCRELYTPDMGVINLPVIDNNGYLEIKPINVFMIDGITAKKRISQWYFD